MSDSDIAAMYHDDNDDEKDKIRKDKKIQKSMATSWKQTNLANNIKTIRSKN